MGVVLLILKIIGIILLVILGLIILVLAVPFCYSGQIHYADKEIKVNFKLHWLWWPFRLTFKMLNKDSELDIRVFGYDILQEREEKYEHPKATVKLDYSYRAPSYEKMLKEAEIAYEQKRLEESEIKTETITFSDLVDEFNIHYIDKKNILEKLIYALRDVLESIQNSLEKIVYGFRNVIEGIYNFVDRLISGIIEVAGTTSENLDTAMGKLKDKVIKIRRVIRFVKNKATRKAIVIATKMLIKIFKHILPRNIHARVDYGLEEPDQTGMVLAGFAAFLGIFKIKPGTIEIQPHFEREMIDAEAEFKGHIIVGVLLWYTIRIVLNKNLFGIIKMFTEN